MSNASAETRRSNAKRIVAILGAVGLLLLLICAGIVAFILNRLSAYEDDLIAQLSGYPEVTELVGDVLDLEPDL